MTSQDLDPNFLEIDKDGRITLVFSTRFARNLVEQVGGPGLAVERGKLTLSLGPNNAFDKDGRLSSSAGGNAGRLTDNTGGTVDQAGEITGNTTSDIATIVEKLNDLITRLTPT